MKRQLLVLALVAALLAGLTTPFASQAQAASGVHSTHVYSHPAAFDKTKFLLHLGAAYFAFHHFVWVPYKAGKFTSGGRIIRFVRYGKAALALLFSYHELKAAYDTAKNSNSPLLHAIISPLQKLGDAFNAVAGKFAKHSFSSSDLTSLDTQANSFQGLAKTNGFGFVDKTVSVPGQ